MAESMAGHGITGTADAGAFLSRLVRLDPAALVRLRPAGPGRVEMWGRVPWGVLVGRTVAAAAAMPGTDGAAAATPVTDGTAPGSVAAGADGASPAAPESAGPEPAAAGPDSAAAGPVGAGRGSLADAGQDVTVLAADLLARIERNAADLPPRRDADWRWPLPPAADPAQPSAPPAVGGGPVSPAADPAQPSASPAVGGGPAPVSAGRTVEDLPVAEVRRVATAAREALRDAAAHGVRGRAVGQRALRDALLDHVPIVVTPPGADAAPVQVSQRLVQAVVRMGFLGPERPGDDERVRVRVVGRWTGLLAPYGAAWAQATGQFTLRPKVGYAQIKD
jgi:hypothetical protein